jgi:drug/metabolite transporter (DMT)-like permease
MKPIGQLSLGWRTDLIFARFDAQVAQRPNCLLVRTPSPVTANAASPHPPGRPSAADPHAVWPGLLLALLGAIAFSGKAIIVKLAYRHGVDAVTLIAYRMLFALPLFLLLSWWAGRGKARLAQRDWLAVLGLGFCGYYLASSLDFAGLQYISASLERLILYLNPTLVLALGVFVFRKSATRRQLIALAVSYSGVLLVFGHEVTLAGAHTALGALLVFGSAVSYAVYLAFSGQEVQRLGAMRLTGLATTVACLLCIAQFLLLRPLSALAVAPEVIWLSVLNATLCTFAPVLMVMMAIERIGATLTAQTGMIGPLSTILMGVLILGEPFTVWVACGTVLVLAGVWMLAKWR